MGEAQTPFRDLVDVDKLQSLMERFHTVTDIPCGIIDPDNDILVAVGWQPICTDFHRRHPLTCARCHESDATLRVSAERGETMEYRCQNGLWDVAIPLVVEHTFYATLFVGQFFYEDEEPDLDFFRSQAQTCGFEERSYLEALAAVPRYSRARMADIVAYYRELAAFIIDLADGKAKTLRMNRVLEAAVARRTAELERSNAELQQFAYAASHDLQEPLRMVSSYVQLIRRRLGDRLDADTEEFIGYAVDGAKRMSGMIQDLLEYSRVQTCAAEAIAVNAGDTLAAALQNLGLAIEAAGATVTSGPMPVVFADAGQLTRLFQNLVSNALKYVAEGTVPQVTVTAERDGLLWRFAVADNGIGVPAESSAAIFGIFHRLHGREHYSGNGVGLSISKRIVERHGGTIWVDAHPGGGSIFRFTLPAGG